MFMLDRFSSLPSSTQTRNSTPTITTMKTLNRSAVIFAAIFTSLTTTLSTNILSVEPRQVSEPAGPLIWDCSYKDKDIVACYSKKSWLHQDWSRCNCVWQRDGPLVYQKCEHNLDCEPEISTGHRCGQPRVGLQCATCEDSIIWAASASATIFHYPALLVRSLPIGVPLLTPIGTSSAASSPAQSTTTAQPSAATQASTVSGSSGNSSSFSSVNPALGPDAEQYAKDVARQAPSLPSDSQRMTFNRSHMMERAPKNNPNSCRFIVRGRGWPGKDDDQDVPRGAEEAWLRVYFPNDLTLDYIKDKLRRGLKFGLMDPIDSNDTGNPLVCGNRFLTTSFYLDKALRLGSVPEFLHR